MAQLLLFPDPRPLVERLGAGFFRRLPDCPGVYLMRDQQDTVLYVGKAKNLRQRLGHYRVANPDRMPRRHLRLLRAVDRIDWQECADEAAALAREAALLRELKPRFNRAGVWRGLDYFLAWRVTTEGVALAILKAPEPGWICAGPHGAVTRHLQRALLRLLWLRLNPSAGLAGMPAGWFAGQHGALVTVPCASELSVREVSEWIASLTMAESGQAPAWLPANAKGYELERVVEDVDFLAKRQLQWVNIHGDFSPLCGGKMPIRRILA